MPKGRKKVSKSISQGLSKADKKKAAGLLMRASKAHSKLLKAMAGIEELLA